MDNCFHLAHKDTIVILDDTMFQQINGPGRVWLEYLSENKVIQLNTTTRGGGVGMTWGKYKF